MSSSRGGKKQSDSGYILKMVPTEFADIWDMECEGKKIT